MKKIYFNSCGLESLSRVEMQEANGGNTVKKYVNACLEFIGDFLTGILKGFSIGYNTYNN